jgi:heme-degrading monooxygenase HmoA
MIRVIYRWKVHAGQEDAFARGWSQGTRTIRATYQGAHGSVLLRSQREPSEFIGIAHWESLQDCQRFWRSAHPDPEALRMVSETGTFLSREICEELHDLEDGCVSGGESGPGAEWLPDRI